VPFFEEIENVVKTKSKICVYGINSKKPIYNTKDYQYECYKASFKILMMRIKDKWHIVNTSNEI
jgi:hypothetical protein